MKLRMVREYRTTCCERNPAIFMFSLTCIIFENGVMKKHKFYKLKKLIFTSPLPNDKI